MISERRLLNAILIAAGILDGGYGTSLAATGIGEPAPALVLPEIGGGKFDLAALRGKVVILNFWATWCAPCRAEMPALDAYYARFHEKGIELVGVSIDHRRDSDAVTKAAQAVHYPVALLADAEANGFGKPGALPVTYIIDPAGNVRAVLTPDTAALTSDSLKRTVAPFLPDNQATP